MLRSALVWTLILVGSYYTIKGPFYGLIFYLGNAYFRPEEWVWSASIQSLHLSLVIGSYVAISSLFSRHKFIWNGKIALLGLFLFHAIFSTVMSEYADYSWPYIIEFSKVVVIDYLIVVLTTDFAKFRSVILTIILALGVMQGKQGWFYLLTSPGQPNANPVSFLGDNNGTAVGMLMLTPLVGLLAQTTQNSRAKNCYYLLFIGCLYRALSTFSRGGFLASIAMGGAWWMRSRYKLKGMLIFFIVLGLVLPALPDQFWGRMRTIQTYKEDGDESALSRLHFWAVAREMAAANPIVGIGFNGYNAAYNDYDFSYGVHGKERSVHSSFFGVLAELGYVGFLLYILILGGAFLACARVRSLAAQRSLPSELNKSANALETSLIAFIVGGSFVPWQYNEMLWHVIGLSIALQCIALQHKGGVPLGEQENEELSALKNRAVA
jgi:probable O-glycosylation ligase (exosortase A-associated)